MKRSSILFVLYSLIGIGLSGARVSGETRDLILVAGQSNAVGYDANPDDLPVDETDKNVLFWFRTGDPPPDRYDTTSSRKWTTLGVQPKGTPGPKEAVDGMPPLPRQYGNFQSSKGGFGPEIGFSREWQKQGGAPLAIVKVALSGTGLRTDWNPADPGPSGACYRALVEETRMAIAAAAEQGVELRPRGMIWVQGESDSNPQDAANYEQALAAMLAALRKDLKSPDLLALLSVNSRFGNGKNPHVATVIAAQKSLADRDPLSQFVDTDGAETLGPSHTHFTAKGTLDIGRRFAASYQEYAAKEAVTEPARQPETSSTVTVAQGKRKLPNIIFLLTDDQGYGDISAHGNPVLKTPHLDRLRAESVRFTDFHVSPTCAPTRSALMTGRHEFKNGVTHTILERERMTLDATTIAQVLKSAGYTTGIFGKWHLGDEAEYQPNARGFDEVYIHGGGGIGQTYPGSCGDAPGNKYFDPAILHNGKFEKTKGYCTDLFYQQATTWIDAQRKKGRPFFAYVPTNAPHAPYIAKPKDRALYESAMKDGKGLNENAISFFGMLECIDQNVGQLLNKLDEWGIAEETIVIFMNDNGGTAGVSVFNADMRGSKGTAWLGGTRANSFWRWPGTLKPADCTALSAHIDFFPTLAEISGATIPEAALKQVEGRSLLPLLKNPAHHWEDRHLFTHQGRWRKLEDPNKSKYRMASVRNTRWAMVSDSGGAEPKWQLFDLQNDYAQKNNVIEQHPEVVKELSAAFDQWWEECLPLMVNEKSMGPKINPFQELYYKQFGGEPTPQDLKRMEPKGALEFGKAPRKPRAQPNGTN
ncbi:MAG: sulfatase-like hydrolase/transferase [Planctomycetaceae bacterium]